MRTGRYIVGKVSVCAAVLAVFALAQPQTMAETRTWIGGGGNPNSGNAGNWLEGSPAINTDYHVIFDPANLVPEYRTTANWNTTGFGFSSITLKGDETYSGFVLMGGADNTTVSGPITVESGSHNFNVTSTVTVDSTWEVASGAEIRLASGSPSLTVGAERKITKTGAGNLYMQTAQTGIAGTIQLDAGTITAQNANAMGSASLLLNSGELFLVRDNHTPYGNPVTVAGDVSIASGRINEGVGVNQQLGTLSIGSQVLTVKTGDQVDSGTARVAFDATTLSGNAVFNVTNNVGGVVTRLTLDDVGGAGQGITKTGDGELVLSGDNTYTGSTTVDAGLLLIEGNSSAADGQVTVKVDAILGGSGRTGGDIHFEEGAKFLFDATATLTADGTVSFASFGIADLIGFDETVEDGFYTLIAGDVNLDNVSNVGAGQAVDLGDGRSAYFNEGSLQLVVIPEPATLGVLGVGAALLLLIRRFRR